MQDSHPITSIYLDNLNADIYHSRINREEGNQLFRIRWYGNSNALNEKDYIFMERKSIH